jgi:FMN phosphatase YigB (HAD superfamily)
MMNYLPKMICFDMDGTIADLYAVEGWEPMLRAEDPTPYLMAEAMWNMAQLAEILSALRNLGVEIRIITWLSKESTEEYKDAVRDAKIQWLAEHGFPYDAFHGVQYGATKADSIRKYLAPEENAWLIDDNAKVRNGWHMGEAIDPTNVDILELLSSLLG